MFKYELENFWKPFMGEIDIIIELDEDNGETPTGVCEAKYRMDAHGNGHICLLPGSILTRRNSDSRKTVKVLRELINFIETHDVGDNHGRCRDHGSDVWKSPEFSKLIEKAKEVL